MHLNAFEFFSYRVGDQFNVCLITITIDEQRGFFCTTCLTWLYLLASGRYPAPRSNIRGKVTIASLVTVTCPASIPKTYNIKFFRKKVSRIELNCMFFFSVFVFVKRDLRPYKCKLLLSHGSQGCSFEHCTPAPPKQFLSLLM